jgi:LacI family transcriptional regulator
MPGKITIKDVAKEAGVSYQLVSAVLGGRESTIRFSAATKAKVLAAAARLGFRPSILARSFQANRSFLVGILVCHEQNFLLSDLIRGIQETLQPEGITPLFLSHKTPAEEATNLHLLQERRVDAVITNSYGGDPETYARLVKAGVPVVELFNYQFAKLGIPHVRQDMAAVGYEATRHLLELGHRRIALLTHERYKKHFDADDQWRGYCQALKEAGLKPQVFTHSLACYMPGRVLYWYHGAKEIADQVLGPQRPTAIVCYDCAHVQALIEEADPRGIRVPKDLSLVGYQDWDICETTTPRITTLLVDPFKMGQAAAATILAQLRGETAGNTLVKPDFIHRASTGPAAN